MLNTSGKAVIALPVSLGGVASQHLSVGVAGSNGNQPLPAVSLGSWFSLSPQVVWPHPPKKARLERPCDGIGKQASMCNILLQWAWDSSMDGNVSRD